MVSLLDNNNNNYNNNKKQASCGGRQRGYPARGLASKQQSTTWGNSNSNSTTNNNRSDFNYLYDLNINDNTTSRILLDNRYDDDDNYDHDDATNQHQSSNNEPISRSSGKREAGEFSSKQPIEESSNQLEQYDNHNNDNPSYPNPIGKEGVNPIDSRQSRKGGYANILRHYFTESLTSSAIAISFLTNSNKRGKSNKREEAEIARNNLNLGSIDINNKREGPELIDEEGWTEKAVTNTTKIKSKANKQKNPRDNDSRKQHQSNSNNNLNPFSSFLSSKSGNIRKSTSYSYLRNSKLRGHFNGQHHKQADGDAESLDELIESRSSTTTLNLFDNQQQTLSNKASPFVKNSINQKQKQEVRVQNQETNLKQECRSQDYRPEMDDQIHRANVLNSESSPARKSSPREKRLENTNKGFRSVTSWFGGHKSGNATNSSNRCLLSSSAGTSNLLFACSLVLGGCLLVACFNVKLISGQQLQALPLRSHGPPQATMQPNGGQIVGGGMAGSQNNGLVAAPAAATGPRPGPQTAAGSLVANVNCNKIRGHVTLMPNSQGSVTVSTQINEGPPGEVYQWSVHQFPVKPGAAMCTCSPLILGSKLIDLGEMHGNLPSNQEYSVQSSSLSLFGPDSPVGHSLLLRGLKTGMVACATFLPTSRKSNYRAKFHEPLSGSVTIFQTAFGSSFLSHLMYSNGTRRHSIHRFDLVKTDDDMLLQLNNRPLPLPLTSANSQNLASSPNQLLLEQREHENEISQCRRFTAGEPLLRNMTYQLSVSTENFGMRSRTALVLPQIPFETFSSVYVIVYSEYNPLEPIACAPLKFVKPKTAAAKFQTPSVQGNVLFSQDSPYDPTLARISLQLPNSDGHSYGIDELPMIIRRKSDTRVCPNIREIIYNPHHIEPSSVPAEGEATSDQYAVGDLSGKYGSLAGKSTERIQVSDFNLPLFGPNSIVGRAMTVYSADGVAIACSNVELTTPMTTAFATFDFGIQGQFIFRQPQNDCNGDTYVYIEVSRPMQHQQQNLAPTTGGNSQPATHQHETHGARTLDHNWHVHVNPVDSGLDHLSTSECSAAGPHFNPYNTSTSSIYSRDCTPFNVLRCELGDLASKMFTLEIPPYKVKSGQEPDIGKFFGTDIDLPLCGPVTIVNRSVVVHGPDFGSHRLACSTVIEFKPRSS